MNSAFSVSPLLDKIKVWNDKKFLVDFLIDYSGPYCFEKHFWLCVMIYQLSLLYRRLGGIICTKLCPPTFDEFSYALVSNLVITC